MFEDQNYPQIETLFELASILNNQNNFDEILRLITEKTKIILQTDAVLILMLNPDTQRTIKTAVRSGPLDNNKHLHNLKMQLTGWMSNNSSSLISEDIRTDDRFSNLKLGDLSVKSVIAVMIRMEDEDIGSIIAYNLSGKKTFSNKDLAWLEKISLVSAPYISSLEQRRKFFKPEIADISLRKKYQEIGIIGKSEQFIELLHATEAAARCDVRVVLEGQTGTGKELIARAIHKFSTRRIQPFIAIDCGAIPGNIIESELFGYKRGAFTGAEKDRKGLLEEANNGTLFMDEIANLPYDIQAKFMRFLQEGEIRPLGANQSFKVNVRIISASSQSLFQLVEQGKFREDLYFRLHVYPLPIPSLWERQEDIAILAEHFLTRFSKAQNKRLQTLSPDLLHYLQSLAWRGNIRELENFMERLVAIAPEDTEVLLINHLPRDLKYEYDNTDRQTKIDSGQRSLSENLELLEAKLIRKALVENDWNQSKAARVLDIAEHTIRYKMKKLGIEKPSS